MSDIELDYDYLTQRALRRVVHDVLTVTAELGETPGEHHFYIEFATPAPGVVIPDFLREDYPERMTIVLQHQFDDLTVSEREFSVTLSFKGRPSRLTIPFDAVTSFADPSVQFGMRFVIDDTAGADADEGKAVEEPAASSDAPTESENDDIEGAEVVSLDSFRKK